MNKITAFTFGIALCLFAEASAWAELVIFPTGNSDWTVTITPLPASSSSTPVGKQLQKVQVTQLDNTKRTRFTWSDGEFTEQWAISNLPVIFKEYPNGSVFPIQPGSMEAKAGNAGIPSDLSAFTWITQECLQEKDPINYQGQLCYHYLGSINLPAVSPSARASKKSTPQNAPPPIALVPTEKREAWIDSKTLLPVALDTGTFHCLFVFSPQPPNALEVPPKFRQEITYYKHVMGFN